jgi:hypothetical protein
MNKLEYETVVVDNNKAHENNDLHNKKQQEHLIQTHNNSHQNQQHNQNFSYNVNLKYEPQVPIAGKVTTFEIYITEQRSGNVIQDFETIHDKLMHIIVVGEDLSYFAHIHPSYETDTSTFAINYIFPESGKYKIWIDFKPKGENQTLVAFKLNVMGNPIHKPIPIKNHRQYIKTVDEKYQITLKLPKELKSNNDVDIAFSISNIEGDPTTDLQPLMSAGGHSVIISSNAQEFLHVHPVEEVPANWRGGPDVHFKANFPVVGLYKVWGQFQHENKTITADFILEVH